MTRPTLNLRSRLLAGLALVAVLQITVGVVVITTTRNHLVSQIDARLAAARDASRDVRVEGATPDSNDTAATPSATNRPGPSRGLPDRLGDTFEGVLRSDGTLITFFAPNNTGTELAPPDISLARARSLGGPTPITVGSTTGRVRCRATVRPTGSGDFFVTAIPLTPVDDTVDRLVVVILVAVGLITIVLGLVAWWVIRLGIRPIRRMTVAAGEIAARRPRRADRWRTGGHGSRPVGRGAEPDAQPPGGLVRRANPNRRTPASIRGGCVPRAAYTGGDDPRLRRALPPRWTRRLRPTRRRDATHRTGEPTDER